MNAEQDPELLNFCRKIRCLRQRHHLSRSRMAAILGISTKTLSALEQDIFPSRLGCVTLWYAGKYFRLAPHLLFRPAEEWPEHFTC